MPGRECPALSTPAYRERGQPIGEGENRERDARVHPEISSSRFSPFAAEVTQTRNGARHDPMVTVILQVGSRPSSEELLTTPGITGANGPAAELVPGNLAPIASRYPSSTTKARGWLLSRPRCLHPRFHSGVASARRTSWALATKGTQRDPRSICNDYDLGSLATAGLLAITKVPSKNPPLRLSCPRLSRDVRKVVRLRYQPRGQPTTLSAITPPTESPTTG